MRGYFRTKDTLYLFLFVALNVIEWLKATRDGDVWKVAVNCIGPVMMVMIMSAYPIKDFLNWWNGIWTFICLAAMIGVYIYWKVNTVPYILLMYVTGVINIWWIVMVAVHLAARLWRRKVPCRKWNVLGIMWVMMSCIMILSVSGRVWPVWFLGMYGLFYLTEYSAADRRSLIHGMVNGTLLSFLIIQTYAYCFRPYDEVRYKGAFVNCNMMALYYLIQYCMILIKLHWLKLDGGRWWQKTFWLFGAGVLLVFQFMTLSRTAFLAATAVTVVYAIWVMRGKWRLGLLGIFGRAVLLGLSAVLAFPAVFASIRWLPTVLKHPVWYTGEYHEDRVHSFDAPDSGKYVSLEEFLESALGRFMRKKDAQEAEASALEAALQEGAGGKQEPEASAVDATWQEGAGGKQEAEASAVDAAWQEGAGAEREAEVSKDVPVLGPQKEWTSAEIRFAIWDCYRKDLTWRGHSEDQGYYLITEDYRCWHAQNLWLQVAYYYGIPAGILLTALTPVMIFFYLSGYGKGKFDKRYGIIPIMMIIAFFTFGTLEVVWNPGQLILCLFFLVQHPLFWKKDKDDKRNDREAKQRIRSDQNQRAYEI